MNILFLTLVSFESLTVRSIYTDLLREFKNNGHEVYMVSPVERRYNVETHLVQESHTTILRLKTGNTLQTNIIEKGISTLMIGPSYKHAIKKFFSNVRFDLVLYSTPPITAVSAIDYVKKRDGARTYLLLKDIFPQNAVDIGMLRTTGIKGIVYRFFLKQERRLYSISDRIGCMSQANVEYVINHNPDIDPNTVEVCPNSIEVVDKSVNLVTRNRIREEYGIPLDKKVFVYGGNLGKPQGIPFLIECMRKCSNKDGAFFLIIGGGTEYPLIEEYIESENPKNLKLMKRIPKDEYDSLIGACDVGLVFLDHRFTIPNFPSRLLSYMAAKLPVLACTDPNTDLGNVLIEGGFGWWCESNNAESFSKTIDEIIKTDTVEFGRKAFVSLQLKYNVKDSYQIIRNWMV